MADPYRPPRGECRQCWAHAHDRSIHTAGTRPAPTRDRNPASDHFHH
ncbi:pRL2-8 [Streptomyces sp. NPDC002409]